MSETLHAEAPLANSPEARTETGALKDQATTTSSTTETKVEPKTESTETKVEPKVEDKDGKSLLTKKDEPQAGAPEKYEAFTAPEGLTLNPEVITKAEAVFKELGLNQTQAQSLVNFYAENAAKDAAAGAQAYETLRTEWQTKVKSDPEMGNRLPEIKRDVSKALDVALGAPGAAAFKQALDDTGAGDHPDVVRTLWKLASRWTEGTHVTGKGPATTGQTAPNSRPKSPGAALWPNLPSANG